MIVILTGLLNSGRFTLASGLSNCYGFKFLVRTESMYRLGGTYDRFSPNENYVIILDPADAVRFKKAHPEQHPIIIEVLATTETLKRRSHATLTSAEWYNIYRDQSLKFLTAEYIKLRDGYVYNENKSITKVTKELHDKIQEVSEMNITHSKTATTVEARPGDKYIIELDESYYSPTAVDSPETLYRVKGFNSLVFDSKGLEKLTPYEEKPEVDVAKSVDEAKYELYSAITIAAAMSPEELHACFCTNLNADSTTLHSVLQLLSPEEFMYALDHWITKGDEIQLKDSEDKGIVFSVNDGTLIVLFEGRTDMCVIPTHEVIKTGKHFDLDVKIGTPEK